MAASTDCRYVTRLVYCIIGMAVGLSVFMVFGFRFHNWNAGLWGLISGLTATVALCVHICNRRGRWDNNPDGLKTFMLSGCFVQLAGVCGFITYMTLAITLKQGLIIDGNGYYLTCVWCFMVWKWGFMLFYYSRIYMRIHSGAIYSIIPCNSGEEATKSYGT